MCFFSKWFVLLLLKALFEVRSEKYGESFKEIKTREKKIIKNDKSKYEKHR